MNSNEPFTIQHGNIFAVPITHYNMEMAAQVRLAYEQIKPDCVAVELAETMELQLLHAASRLPDVSVVITYDQKHQPLYYLSEPCEPTFEGLRSALDDQVPAFCIDLDVDAYPDFHDTLPDPYAIHRIGLKEYYHIYKQTILSKGIAKSDADTQRELYMAKRLKELSLSYDRILFIGGMTHVESILKLVDRNSFPKLTHAHRETVELCTLTEASCRDVLSECGFMTLKYEEERSRGELPDRQQFLLNLYKKAAENYKNSTGNPFPAYHFRNLMKFARNYSLISNHLMPDLFQTLTVAKSCVDHNYAYETWELATTYPHLKNIDSLPEIDLSIEDIWGHSKLIQFHTKEQSRKKSFFQRRRKDTKNFKFEPPGPFTICSHTPEDTIIENFGTFLRKKGTQIETEESSRTIPFTTSMEDGVDTKETIRHWYEKKLYVKVAGKPPSGVGSVVVIFDEDDKNEKYPWCTTWQGEHEQESDMSFYATPMGGNVVGPGISRCEYGGFLMSYPPRRMYDIWDDPDYDEAESKSEALLMAAIDYAVTPIVVYVANKPPRSILKQFAARYGKKIIYIPMGQLSPITLNKIRVFHVLDGHDKRDIADEYIY